MWLVVGVTLAGAFRLVDSRLGRALRAIGSDETAATLSGINTWATKVQIFVIAAGIASLGGSLYAHYIGRRRASPGSRARRSRAGGPRLRGR